MKKPDCYIDRQGKFSLKIAHQLRLSESMLSLNLFLHEYFDQYILTK